MHDALNNLTEEKRVASTSRYQGKKGGERAEEPPGVSKKPLSQRERRGKGEAGRITPSLLDGRSVGGSWARCAERKEKRGGVGFYSLLRLWGRGGKRKRGTRSISTEVWGVSAPPRSYFHIWRGGGADQSPACPSREGKSDRTARPPEWRR